MKKILPLIFTIIILSCNKDNSEKNIPEDYKIIEMNVSYPNDKEHKYKIIFEYNSNNKINQINHISNKFKLKEVFEYKSGQLSKISVINSNPSLNVNKIFAYDNKGRLENLVIERMIEEDSVGKMKKTGEKIFMYKEDRIEILNKTQNSSTLVEVIELGDNGNFLSLKKLDNPETKWVYDQKSNPNDLIYDKFLIANKLYGIGNLLSIGNVYTHTYEYNDLGFPTKQESYQHGKLQSITTFSYNK